MSWPCLCVLLTTEPGGQVGAFREGQPILLVHPPTQHVHVLLPVLPGWPVSSTENRNKSCPLASQTGGPGGHSLDSSLECCARIHLKGDCVHLNSKT